MPNKKILVVERKFDVIQIKENHQKTAMNSIKFGFK